jgi:diguanylate cyclase (GGDEF)-like protein
VNLASWLRSLLPDGPQLVDAAVGGERLVARLRLGLVLLALATVCVPGTDPTQRRMGLGISLVALALALLVHWAVTRRYRPWMGLASCALDVTFVSAGLASFVWVGIPHLTVNSKVLFDVYFLALLLASLRYDWRLTALAGGLATVQYAGLALWVGSTYPLNAPSYAPYLLGTFSWPIQAGRVLLLLGAAVGTTAVVLRAQHLRRLSATDRLTGLWNRGAFEDRLGEEWSRARRHERPLSLAILDLDRFKDFNDTHGHAAGDAALRTLAEALRAAVRREDVVARWGGEEFVVLLPETQAHDALARIEDVRRSLEGAVPLTTRTGRTFGITASAGVASWPGDGLEVDEVLAAADRRLYAAKQRGRNRVVGPEAAA